MAMGKAVDGDNAKTYLETTLGAALDKVDAHDHSGTTKGIALTGSHPGLTTITCSSDITGRRVKATGTSIAAGDFSLSSGWGSTATVSAVSGTDQRGTFTITTGGTGIGSSPTVTFTFHDGTWTTAPVVLCSLTGGTGAGTPALPINNASVSATSVQWQMFFTPTTALTYTFTYIVMG